MLLLLEEYFKSYPTRKRVIESLYDNGISIVNGKLFLRDIEISISEIAKSLAVNRRTVYETIKTVETNEVLRMVMSKLAPMEDIAKVAPVIGSQVIMVYTTPGFFSRVLSDFTEIVKSYGCNVRDIMGKNCGKDDTYIRIVFYRTVPARILDKVGNIFGVSRVVITTPELNPEYLACTKCEVVICPNKLSTNAWEKVEID
ncbi:MAG: HTH domain-containing protein [Thermoplasmataceae archaeon]